MEHRDRGSQFLVSFSAFVFAMVILLGINTLVSCAIYALIKVIFDVSPHFKQTLFIIINVSEVLGYVFSISMSSKPKN